MTKQLLIIGAGAILVAAAVDAQTSQMELAFQQPGWTASPEYKFNVVHMNRPDGQTGPVLGKPFSGIEVRHTVQTLADGTHVDQPEATASYRDAQGRMRAENPDRILIYDPVGGFVYNLETRTKTYRKTPLSGNSASTTIAATRSGTWIAADDDPPARGDLSARQMHAHGSVAPVTEDLQPQIINGIRTKGARVTMTVPKGTFGNDRDIQVVNERWYSDDLQVLVNSSNSDPRFGLTTYELTHIVQAPPAEGLFQIPTDYTITEDNTRRR